MAGVFFRFRALLLELVVGDLALALGLLLDLLGGGDFFFLAVLLLAEEAVADFAPFFLDDPEVGVDVDVDEVDEEDGLFFLTAEDFLVADPPEVFFGVGDFLLGVGAGGGGGGGRIGSSSLSLSSSSLEEEEDPEFAGRRNSFLLGMPPLLERTSGAGGLSS